jgi:hypothetical protein
MHNSRLRHRPLHMIYDNKFINYGVQSLLSSIKDVFGWCAPLVLHVPYKIDGATYLICCMSTWGDTPTILNYKTFDFLTLSLITYLIQKIYVNIVKFKLFLKNFY